MTPYNLALFVHMIGLITLFAAMVQHQRAGARLRRAGSLAEVRVLVELIGSGKALFGIGSLTLLLSGIWMVAAAWHRPPPWVLVGLAGLVISGVLGARAGGGQVHDLEQALPAAGDEVTPAVAAVIQRPSAWMLTTASNGMGLAIVFMMSVKPGWIVSLAAIALGALGGAAVGARLPRPLSAPPASPARGARAEQAAVAESLSA